MESGEPFDTIDRICDQENWSAKDIAKLRELTQIYPDEPEVWVVLGDLMQNCDQEFPIEESMVCYRKALECDETCAGAYEEIASAMDTHWDDFEGAEANFRRAIECGAGDSARIGLARVLAQVGRNSEALAFLDDCLNQKEHEVIQMRQEIAEGFWFNPTE